METGLRGKNALVTEVGNPLGKSAALAFAREGAKLVLGSFKADDSLFDAAEEARASGAKVIACRFDAANEASVRQFVQHGLDEFGPVHVLLNSVPCAGADESLATMSFDAWKQAIHYRLTGALFLCRAVLPGMMEQRWGRLIHFIGLGGFVGGGPAAGATQMGMVGLSRGIATQYGKYGITANCIGCGGLDGLDDFPSAYLPSKMNDPLGRSGSVQEFSSAAIYLASEDAGYITGQCYLVNGGRCFL
jgi:3-oxoacyl-[acyl-carrier protein] reductase